MLFGARLGGYAEGETTLAHAVLAVLQPGMLCLADRQFFGYALWHRAAVTGAPGRLGDPPPRAYAEARFDLREGLKAPFGRPVDLKGRLTVSGPSSFQGPGPLPVAEAAGSAPPDMHLP